MHTKSKSNRLVKHADFFILNNITLNGRKRKMRYVHTHTVQGCLLFDFFLFIHCETLR